MTLSSDAGEVDAVAWREGAIVGKVTEVVGAAIDVGTTRLLVAVSSSEVAIATMLGAEVTTAIEELGVLYVFSDPEGFEVLFKNGGTLDKSRKSRNTDEGGSRCCECACS